MERLIDLHIHSNISDGKLSPKEVIDRAYKNNVRFISIADHDSIDAYNEDLFEYAEKLGIKIIPGLEISTKIKKCGIHVLGYNYDINNLELKNTLIKLRNARHDYLYNVSDLLKKLGYVVNINDLDKIESVTKAHIALDVINNKDNKDLLIKNFGYVPNMGEFIETIMNEGCPAYVEKVTITPKEAANLIRKASGVVILAHPVAYKYEDNLSNNDILSIVLEMEADGIEANYIYYNRDDEKIDECLEWNNFAKDNNLITTVGSDFHRLDNIHPDIGLINENINLSSIDVDKILDKLIN